MDLHELYIYSPSLANCAAYNPNPDPALRRSHRDVITGKMASTLRWPSMLLRKFGAASPAARTFGTVSIQPGCACFGRESGSCFWCISLVLCRFWGVRIVVSMSHLNVRLLRCILSNSKFCVRIRHILNLLRTITILCPVLDLGQWHKIQIWFLSTILFCSQ